MASYFVSGRKKLLSAMPNKNFTLTITFENDEQLADFDNFKRVYIDDSNNVCWDKNPEIDSETNWNNKVDLSSDVCYVESVAIATLV